MPGEPMRLLDVLDTHQEIVTMDKDRIDGAVEKAKGSAKEIAGKITGDAKLEAEGKAQKLGGQVQNVVGGVKDTLRGKA